VDNFGKNDGNVSTSLGYFIGQNIYTPDHISIRHFETSTTVSLQDGCIGEIFMQRRLKTDGHLD